VRRELQPSSISFANGALQFGHPWLELAHENLGELTNKLPITPGRFKQLCLIEDGLGVGRDILFTAGWFARLDTAGEHRR